MNHYTEAAFRALRDAAIKFASEHHAGQTYGPDKPYVWHLREVAENCMKWIAYLPHGVKAEHVILGGWLHDTKEDCGVDHETLAFLFGEEVADIVEGVTDELGATRKERKPKTWAKARSKGPGCVYVKLSDFKANISAGGKTDMYRKEYPLMKSIMFTPGEMDPIWAELDELVERAV